MESVQNRVERIDGGLVHTRENPLAGGSTAKQVEILSIVPWGRNGLRVRVTAGPAILDTSWALTEPVTEADGAEISVNESEAVIRNGKISASISDRRTQAGFLQFFRHTDKSETRSILSEHDYVVGAHNPGTRVFQPLTDSRTETSSVSSLSNQQMEGLYYTENHFASRDGERLYGMGLNSTGSVNLKGCVIDLYQRHVKHVVPFLVSSEGYGMLWNNPSLGRVEFGNNMTRWVSRGCRQIDYYITAGDTYAEILERYADVTGHVPELPEWAAGFWQCKNRYRTQEEFMEVAREFQRLGIPLSVLVIDYRHWRRWGDWKLDPEFWPDPEAMVKELDEMGTRIMISPWVLMEEESENYEAFRSEGVYIKNMDGSDSWFPGDSTGRRLAKAADRPRGRTLQYDPTHPDAGPFLLDRWKRNYMDIGIKTFWLDPCDDLNPITDFDKVRYHIGPAIETHGYYPVAHQKNIYEGMIAAGETEIVTICRSSWAGSQRYGASPAAHDIESSFRHLHEYMMAGLNLGMAGIPWGAAEIGGFVSGVQDDEFHELVIRWYQYGVFTPIFRTHGARRNNEPWNIGGDSYRHIRAAIMLRERLRPYIMDQMKLASARGLPPMRPLFFDFEHDPKAADVEDEFLFGPDLLVAPITGYGERERTVYLPAGSDWTSVWNDPASEKIIDGGTTITAAAPIEHIPVFARGSNDSLLRLFRGLDEL